MPFVIPVFRISHRTRFRIRQIECCDWGDYGTVDLSLQGERLLGSIPRYQ